VQLTANTVLDSLAFEIVKFIMWTK